MLRFMNRANALTVFGLTSALFGALLAVQGKLHFAMVALVVAGLADLFDGPLARTIERSDEEKLFGQRLDSLADAVSFGAAGAVILYGAALHKTPPEQLLCLVFAACAVWRLAYFDTVGMQAGEEGKAPRFVGLPTTYTALFVPFAALTRMISPEALRIALNVTALVMAVAMTSSIPIPKPGRKSYPVLLLLALGAFGFHIGMGVGAIPTP